jgi:hypothetical protein
LPSSILRLPVTVRVNTGLGIAGVVPLKILNLRMKDLSSGVVAVATLMLVSSMANKAAGTPERVGSDEWK